MIRPTRRHFAPTGRREIAENVLTAALCTAATVLIEGVANAVERRREERAEQARKAEKKRKKKGK